MFAPSVKTAKLLAVLVLLAGSFPLCGSAHATNATQRAADRANHDRWARNEPTASHKSSTDEDDSDDDSDSGHHSHATEVPPGHTGELNGHLSLHGW